VRTHGLQTVLEHWCDSTLDGRTTSNGVTNGHASTTACLGHKGILCASHTHVYAIVASITHVTHAVYETAAAAQHCVERHEKDITLPLQHLALYCRAVCTVLQRREQLSSDVNKLNDTLARKLCDLQKVPHMG
jgi:hypothetical protein